MRTIVVGVIVGSVRKESLNLKLSRALARLAPEDLVFKPIEIAGLPLYNEDDEPALVPAVEAFRLAAKASDAFLFVTPEHNRSFPSALKNALDTGSRPRVESVWTGKPAGVVGITPGAMGTAMAQQHLRNVLSFLNLFVLPQPEAYLRHTEGFFDAEDGIRAESRAFLQEWMDSFAGWVRSRLA